MSHEVKLPLRFKFDVDKFIAAVCFFAEQGFKDLDKLKVCKLLFYADKYHVTRFGRPIIGDTYYHLENGPIPSRALDIMNELICGDKVFNKTGLSNQEKFQEYLKVKKSFLSHRYPTFEAIKKANLDCLSASEQEALRDAVKRYGQYDPPALIDLTHKEAAWQETEDNQEIDYRLLFKDNVEASNEALEYMESCGINSELLSFLEK
jgi:uncharacterized phage-associated protein